LSPEHFDDPVAAYDRVAAHYAALSRRRDAYLRGVEREITSRAPTASQSLLDVGSGDGSRALAMASQLGIKRVVLVEPSKEMAPKSAGSAEIWPARAEDLGSVDGAQPQPPPEQFDVITCLWNVLGHVPTAQKRLRALTAVARLLAPQGKFFLDVNHRYNLRAYGILPTSARWLHDLLSPSENNGDVLAKWSAGAVSTYGHVFTHSEIMRLAASADLEIEERVVLDYENGRTRRFAFQGNLLYVFRRSSRIDSSSAPQTS
jgi:2-polyprenyl-3-methyl-5-hydroxy-6-metoxy-1,4-benzoquinol methylase